ncbi:type VI secretion protein [Halopseudomonas oceani]|uniref:Type VI secretion protein n=1 Tax=Halopseudomonas oceani TaxID=1708783 RepID=A0A2P4EUK8_9GAMM|nr:type VI secretion protein [Halopseudomonas oceani]POB03162.1 type VI secretion protein [Halopseudomonas oceani]
MPHTPPLYRALLLSLLCLLAGCSGNMRFDDDQYRPLNKQMPQPLPERRAWN